jgi:hypothetical protein
MFPSHKLRISNRIPWRLVPSKGTPKDIKGRRLSLGNGSELPRSGRRRDPESTNMGRLRVGEKILANGLAATNARRRLSFSQWLGMACGLDGEVGSEFLGMGLPGTSSGRRLSLWKAAAQGCYGDTAHGAMQLPNMR